MSAWRCLLVALTLSCVPAVGSAANCSLSVIGLSFGSYDVFGALPLEITGSVTVTCNEATPYTITLSPGAGSYSGRSMPGTSGALTYNLYLDPGRTTVWGDGSAGTGIISDTGTSGTYTVYGRISAGQNAFIGNYSDSIIVTLTY
jgi:spore coat protein U-like protein